MSLAVLTFVFFSISKSKLPGYILPAAPAIALVVGWAIDLAIGGRSSERAGSGFRVSLAVASLAMFAGGAGAFWLATHPPASLDIGPVMLVAGAILLFVGCTLGAPVLVRTVSATSRGLLLAAAGLFLFLLNLERPLELLDPLRSVKPAALYVSANARPDDLIASYGSLMHGLTFYTGRRTAIVGGAGELSFGADAESTQGWVYDGSHLPDLVDRRTVFLVVPKDLESRAIADAEGQLRTVHDGGRFKVLSNAPPVSRAPGAPISSVERSILPGS